MTIAIGSPEWVEARRQLITATDIPVILGLSPWSSEADLADEKRGIVEPPEATTRMRLGSFLEPFIAALYTERTGIKVRRWKNLAVHPDIPWAAASPDYHALRPDRRLVELKRYARASVADGLPQYVEAQVQWQLGVTGYARADVAILTADELLDPFEVVADPAQFVDLVDIAADFRRRLADGGPFARDAARIKRDHPRDDGSTIEADPDVSAAVRDLINTRAALRNLEEREEVLKTAVQARMGDASTLVGSGFTITWKRSKDKTVVDWQSIADGLLRTLPEPERSALVGIHTSSRPGVRAFLLRTEGDD